MPNRRATVLAGEFYHLHNRGVDRGVVFFNEDHYRYFERLLGEKAARYAVEVVAFCLMPNHYHLLVRAGSENTIGRFVNSLLGSYVQGLNAARKRVGPLFQGRYKSVHVARDEYLAHVARYIHLNPVAAGLVVRPQDWPHSNYAEMREDGVLIGGIFADGQAYARFVDGYQTVELPASLKLAGS
jgi:REP element-mobilizing transposase RayT